MNETWCLFGPVMVHVRCPACRRLVHVWPAHIIGCSPPVGQLALL